MVFVADNTFLGSAGADQLSGTADKDLILGLPGSDTAFGGSGADLLFGNQDADLLFGNQGDDTCHGGQGNDSLWGGQGGDLLLGNLGNDLLLGNEDSDTALGGEGDDLLFGNAGADLQFGNTGDDIIYGGQDSDTLRGGKGNDRLFGNKGDDFLYGDLGADFFTGGEGNDRFIIGNGTEADVIADFTDGEDLIELTGDLTFDSINIVSGTGTLAGSTIIEIQGTNQAIAVLQGVASSALTRDNFLPVTGDGTGDGTGETPVLPPIPQSGTGETSVLPPTPPPDSQPPAITAALASDTGTSNTDKITSNPAIAGTVTDVSQIAQFRGGFSDTLVDVLPQLQAGGTFSFSREQLEVINGAALADGEHTLKLVATDAAGNESSLLEVSLTLDTTQPALEIAAPADNAQLAPGAQLTGTVGEALASLSYRFEGGTQVPVTLEGGAFEVALDVSTLAGGEQTLTVTATDIAGNVTSTAVTVSKDETPPAITAALTNDTGTEADGITSDPSVAGIITDVSEIVNFRAGLDEMPVGSFVDVLADLQENGSFSFNRQRLEEISGAALADGEHTLKLVATDAAGNESSLLEVSLTLDATAPEATAISGTLNTSPSFVDVSYDQPVGDAAFAAGNYTLTKDGQAVSIVSVEQLTPRIARVNFGASLQEGSYQLAIAPAVSDIAGNALAEPLTFDFTVAPEGVEISPSNGEGMVGLNRETIVRFGEKVDPATVNSDSFYLIANGDTIPGRIEVSSTEEFATFFYDEPLPASTEVRVVVDGDKIVTREGEALDGDGDGTAGGVKTADFRTLPLTRIEGTNVFGYVYDSYNKNPDGSDKPVVGATIRVDGFPDLQAVTDESGYFVLEDVPAPEFFVYIDGSTASTAPAGTQYASLGKPFHSVPGQETQLTMDGETFNVYLPPMAASDVQQLSAAEDTQVGFGEASKAQLQALFPDIDPSFWELTNVTFPANSARDDEGNAATQGMIVPVAPDRLPAPLPPNLDPQLVISIQAGGASGFNRESNGGATNFDVPAPVTFPNLDGLAPGEKSLLWSFNHDAGKWEVIGTGTVSEDGKSVVSDPGVGVRAPGWHFINPGTQIQGPPEPPPPPPPCLDKDQIIESTIDVLTGVEKCLVELTSVNKWIKVAFEAATGIRSLINNTQSLLDQIKTAKQQGQTITWGEIANSIKLLNDGKSSLVAVVEAIKSQGDPVSKALSISKCIEAILNTFESICNRVQEKPDSPCNTPAVKVTCIGLAVARTQLAKVNGLVEQADSGLKRLGLEFLCKAVDQLLSIAGAAGSSGTPTQGIQQQSRSISRQSLGVAKDAQVSASDPVPPEIIETLNTLLTEASAVQGDIQPVEEFGTAFQGFEDQVEKTQDNTAQLYFEFAGTPKDAPYLIDYGTFQLRGKTDGKGQISSVLPPSTEFTVSVYDQLNNRLGTFSGKTGASGSPTNIPPLRFMSTSDLPDTDGDGLVDDAERVIGTIASNTDSDGDGINDLAELQQGLDPLGGRAFPTGIISSLPLLGEAKAVAVEGSTLNAGTQTAYVATGSHGLAVVDTSQFDNPIILGQLDLPGDATDVAADTSLQIAAVAGNSGGLHFVDVSDPMLPTLSRTANISANQVEIADGIAYATEGNSLHAIDLLTGEELQTLTLPGQGRVTGLAREGTKLYAFTSGSDTFSVIDIAREGAAGVLGQLTVNIASQEVGVFAGNGVAYLAGSGLRTVDVSNPSAPTLIGDATQLLIARDVALNGSGLALLASEGQGLRVYNVANPQITDAFLTGVDTPGFANKIAVASGIAFVADGSAGLQVINYLPFDSAGAAPTLTISAAGADADPATEGIQVQEGSSIAITAGVSDDVQVRNVELLVNDEVVRNDVSFPFDLEAVAPNITADSNTATIQVRATDTGGNTVLSNILTVNLVEDTFAPVVSNTTPAAGGFGLNIPFITIRFNEPIDTSLADLSGLTLTNLGADGAIGGGDDTAVALSAVETPSARRLVILSEGTLPLGNYQLTVDPSIIADRAGNGFAEPFTLSFINSDVPPDTVFWISDSDGDWNNPANWSTGTVPGANDNVAINRLNANPAIAISGNVSVKSIRSEESLIISGGSLSVSEESEVNGDLTVSSGSVIAGGEDASFTANGEITFEGASSLSANSGGTLTLSGVTAIVGSTRFEASDAGSTINLPALTSFSDDNSDSAQSVLNAYGGVISADNLASLTEVDLSSSYGGTLSLPALTSYTGNNSITAVGGGVLTLGGLQNLASSTNIVAQDSDSTINLPALTSFSDDTSDSAQSILNAYGGVISADNLASLTEVDLSSYASNLTLPSLTSYAGNNSVNAANAAQLTLDALATITGTLTVSADGTGTKVTLPALNSSQGSFTPSNGGTVALKDTTLTS
ncbi:Ig-like domain-containing protein [Kamptonema formosum]|uniref:Ig-like domain-containing protein n=2 Tax=Kamptonema formosum TaxID=331992 RepID=UPI00034D8338|nr:Ig-like domain-containing protein [Oscillatoria sp. PCC 10802]